MSKLGTGSDFTAFMEDLEREARDEGPAAVAEMNALHEYYGLVSELITLRRRRQMTQKQLEKATGIPQSEVSRIESGHANPTLATLRTLVRALGGEIRIIERLDVVSTASYNERVTSIREQLQLKIERLTESEAAELLAVLEQQKHGRDRGPWPPSFASIGQSGRSDLGARSEEIVRGEFGSQ